MARNQIFIDAPQDDVFAALADPFLYPSWVIGTREVLAADAGWPAPDTRFTYTTRGGVTGATSVVAVEPTRKLTLTTDLLGGRLLMYIDLIERDGGTEVHLEEIVDNDLLQLAVDPVLHARNAVSLLRFKDLIEGSQVPGGSALIDALGIRRHRLDEHPYREIIEGAERCYLAVITKNGPHVTPVAFVLSGGRIWMVIERHSLKGSAVERGSRIGVLIRNGERSVVVQGDGVLLDPSRALVPEHLIERMHSGPALMRYVLSNSKRLGGYLTGGLRAVMDLNPLGRVLLAVTLDRVVSLDGAEVVNEHAARLRRPTPRDVPAEPLDLEGRPSAIVELGETPGPAVLAWETDDGPIALPAFWSPVEATARVPAFLLDGTRSRPAALCLDGDRGSQMQDQIGFLVRGHGRVVSVDGSVAEVMIEQDRTTVWEGAETGTVT